MTDQPTWRFQHGASKGIGPRGQAMEGWRHILTRLAVGAAVYAVLATVLARSVPLPAHAVLGTAFALAFVIFGQPLIVGFGSPRLRRFISCFMAVAIAGVVIQVLLFLRASTPGG